eukprot:Gb_08888 [translate_table: standard]
MDNAFCRSSCERCTLRELNARPSGSRVISEPIISTPKSKSRTMRQMRRHC